jgi:Asp-tRNA(Asn)/Glu-tRNA(Gln) amidotransferase A subunit family amidase
LLFCVCVLQRIRKRAEVHFERAFKQCDIIITPATPTTAETFPAAAHTSGVYDIAKTFEQIRFTQVRHTLM